MNQSTNTLALLSWLEMPGEVINLMRLVETGNNTLTYEFGDPGGPGAQIHMTDWGICTER